MTSATQCLLMKMPTSTTIGATEAHGVERVQGASHASIAQQRWLGTSVMVSTGETISASESTRLKE